MGRINLFCDFLEWWNLLFDIEYKENVLEVSVKYVLVIDKDSIKWMFVWIFCLEYLEYFMESFFVLWIICNSGFCRRNDMCFMICGEMVWKFLCVLLSCKIFEMFCSVYGNLLRCGNIGS